MDWREFFVSMLLPSLPTSSELYNLKLELMGLDPLETGMVIEFVTINHTHYLHLNPFIFCWRVEFASIFDCTTSQSIQLMLIRQFLYDFMCTPMKAMELIVCTSLHIFLCIRSTSLVFRRLRCGLRQRTHQLPKNYIPTSRICYFVSFYIT